MSEKLQRDLNEALDLLETCTSCDLFYNYSSATGLPDDNETMVADVVHAFIKRHRPEWKG